MKNISIVTDSTCDLSPELIEEYHVSVIPLCIVMDDTSYYDREEIVPDQIYAWSNQHNTTPKTAATTYEKALSILKPLMDAKNEIIFIGISEQMSTTCNVVRLIASDHGYTKLHVIDSRNLSTGIGLQVIFAAELAARGKTADEIVREVEQRRDHVKASFVVETLTYLARGGRCNSVTALVGNALHLKPMIVVAQGAMKVGKKYRGKQNAVLLKYVKEMESMLKEADPSHIFITHSGCDKTVVKDIYNYLDNMNYFKRIHVTRAGGVISSHCGPGTLGVLFYTGEPQSHS